MASSALSVPSPKIFQRIGNGVLKAGLVAGFSFTALLAWKAPSLLPFIPVLLVAGIIAWYLFQRPLLNLCLVLASFVLIADFEEGIQTTEVLYGLYYLGFLAHWFVTRLFLYRERIFERREERILFLFLVLMSLSIGVTLVFGGTLRMVMGEWLSLSLLAFYFPVREAVERYSKGLYAMIGVIAWIGLYVLVRNVLNYQEIVMNATYAWQVTRGRAVTNESLLMVPAFISMVYFLYAREWKSRLLTAAIFLAFFGGLILTQSRGYWISFLLGSAFILFIVPPRMKVRLVAAGLLSGLGVLLIAYLVIGDYALLIVTGLFNRFLSIANAVTSDLSLVNRLRESASVWEYIIHNPILGHGMGTTYRFYDLTFEFTFQRAFIHNGYIALLFKFGVWGLGMMLYFLGCIVRRAVRIFRSRTAPEYARLACLGVAAAFAGFTLSANTSNPFYINDAMFIFAVITGIVGGCFTLTGERSGKTGNS